MASPSEIAKFIEPLLALQRLIKQFNDRGMIIGGIAASLLGKPRLTADLDAVLLLSVEQIPQLLEAANLEGLEPRIPNAAEFARKHRVVLLRHRDSKIDIDLSLGILPFEIEAVDRSQIHVAGTIAVRLPTPEDLIILKGVAHRPRDLQDIEEICLANPNLDWIRIETWLKEFSAILEKPEIWQDVAKFQR